MADIQTFKMDIDIPSILTVVGCIEVAIRHPEFPPGRHSEARKIAQQLALVLYQNTDILPPELIRAWWHSGILPESLEDVCRRSLQ